EGLAQYIVSNGDSAKEKGVVIAYDSRHKSYEFAIETAKTLGNHNIQAYVFEDIRSTPELSFAVRYLIHLAGLLLLPVITLLFIMDLKFMAVMGPNMLMKKQTK